MEVISDRYELLEVIASGGMATVWKARDTRLNRLVAVKRPHPAPEGDGTARSLAGEAKAAAALSHPNLITIYDFGTDESGPYLVMELVDGPTLQDAVGGLDAADVREVGARLADALAAIHAAGIVHRDVKPANVIMSQRGPLLTDFGIAIDPNATAEIAGPDAVVATPSYAAPEVLRGEPPTPASDVYSLAVVVDELIRKTGIAGDATVDQIISAALSDTPEARPDAGHIAEVLGRAVAFEPGAGADETTKILEAAPVAAVTAGSSRPDGKRESRPVWLWVAAALALLALGLSGLGLAMSGGDAQADADAAPTSMGVSVSSTTSSSTTSPATTTSSADPTTTVSSLETAVATTRDELESVLSRPPRSDFNQKEVEDVMKKVDEAIEAAREGDLDKAGKKLAETERRLEEKLDGDRLDDARTALRELADLLGVDLDDREDNQDD